MWKKKNKHVHQEHSVSTQGKDIKEGTRGSRTVTILSITFFSLAILISGSLITFTIVFFFSNVTGPSMMTILNAEFWEKGGHPNGNTDAVIVNRHRTPRQGDIIVTKFYHQGGRHSDDEGSFDFYIKRLIATGGQRVYFYRRPYEGNEHSYIHDIIIDGVKLDESKWPLAHESWGRNVGSFFDRIYSLTRPGNYSLRESTSWGHMVQPVIYVPTGGHHGFTRWELHIPQGYVFYIGDNRLQSNDSRSFGPQPARHILGVVADFARNNQTLPQYLWGQVVYYIFFGWAWGSR